MSLLRLGQVFQCLNRFIRVGAFFHPGALEFEVVGLVAAGIKLLLAVMGIIRQEHLFIHAPGVLGYHQQAAAEGFKALVICESGAVFEPALTQAAEFFKTAHLDGVSPHPVDPGIADLLGHHRQRVANSTQLEGKSIQGGGK